MKTHRISAVVLSVGLLFAPATVDAQSEVATAFEVSLGVGRIHASTRHVGGNTGPVLDVTVSRWRQDTSNGNVIVAAGISVQGGGGRELLCAPRASGGCTPSYPEFSSLSALAGWQTLRGRFRVLAGPTLAYADEAALGLQGRVDLAAPLTQRWSLTLNARGFALPSLQGASYQLFDVGVGLRIVQR